MEVRAGGVSLIQSDWSPYEKRGLGHTRGTRDTHIKKGSCKRSREAICKLERIENKPDT